MTDDVDAAFERVGPDAIKLLRDYATTTDRTLTFLLACAAVNATFKNNFEIETIAGSDHDRLKMLLTVAARNLESEQP